MAARHISPLGLRTSTTVKQRIEATQGTIVSVILTNDQGWVITCQSVPFDPVLGMSLYAAMFVHAGTSQDRQCSISNLEQTSL